MEKTANNKTKKCVLNQSNAKNCLIRSAANATTDQPKNALKKSADVSDEDKLQYSEHKKFCKWKEKLSRFCQNKEEKKEAEKLATEKEAVPPSPTAVVASARHNLFKGNFAFGRL